MPRKRAQDIWLNTDFILQLIKEVSTTSELLEHLGLPPNSTSYRYARNFALDNNIVLPTSISTLRFKRKAAGLTKKVIITPSEDIFKERSLASRSVTKRRALDEGHLEYKCYGNICAAKQIALNFWEGVVLHLEHKNGIGDDNRIENLELLCPNCHSLTSTFAGANQKRYPNGAMGSCQQCSRRSKTKICARCNPPKKNPAFASLESLHNQISEDGWEVVASTFDISPEELKSIFTSRLNKLQKLVISDKNEPTEKPQKRLPARQKKGLKNSLPDKRGTINYPPIEELVAAIKERGYRQVSNELNVSDKGLAKHVEKQLGYPLKTKYSRSSRPKKNSGEQNT